MADRIVRERERREVTGISRTAAYTLEKRGESRRHLKQVWSGLVTGAVLYGEVRFFERVEHVFLVIFSYMEDEWAEPCVVVGAVLFPYGGASDGDDYSCACFSDFDG